MMGVLTIGRMVWRARALRFLTLCLLCWTGARGLALWDPMIGFRPVAVPYAPLSTMPVASDRTALLSDAPPLVIVASHAERRPGVPVAGAGPEPSRVLVITLVPARPRASRNAPTGWLAMGRHALRLALLQRLLPSTPTQTGQEAFLAGTAIFGRRTVPGLAGFAARSTGAPPLWPNRDFAGWSGTAWLFVRDGGSIQSGPTVRGLLGGNQAGVRIGYGFGATGRLRAYGRASAAPFRDGEREGAVGVAYAPFAHAPVDLHIEQRFAPRGKGRNALAVMATGGVSAVPLTAGFRLDAYAQAGVIGTRSHTLFGDAAVAVDHDLAGRSGPRLAVGGLAAAAAQPGATRFDIGPRLSLRLPDVANGSRIALDWRHRVAGDARPASGWALTLAADF